MRWLRIALAACLLLAFLALIPFYAKSKDDFNKAISCDDSVPHPLIIIVIDASDPYDSVDADRVSKETKIRLSSLSEPTRFVIIGPNERVSYEPILAKEGCLQPELPHSSSYFLSASDREAYVRVRAQVIASAASSVDRLLRAGPLHTSPLLETTIALSKRHDVRNATAKTVVFYSDMEQNSTALTVYGRGSSISVPVGLEKVSLSGVRVEVKRIVRRTNLGLHDQARLQAFWNEWLTGAGATVEWSK